MQKRDMKISVLVLTVILILIVSSINIVVAQDEQRWIRVGDIHAFFNDDGNECELRPDDFLIRDRLWVCRKSRC